MSNAVFPVLPGLSWSVSKAPMWSTRVQKAVSGREARAAFYSIPLWTFKLSYEFLRAGNGKTELQQLVGFYNARQGAFDSFLYLDPTDNAVVAQQFGVGDGVSTHFQLVRALGSYAEPVTAPILAGLSLYANGAGVSGTIDASTGLATLASAPAAGALLTWTGSFYRRVRFLQDTMDFDNFMKDLWQAKKVEFVSVK